MCGKFTQMMSWGAYVSLADLLAGESPSGDMRSEVVSPMRDAFVVRLSAGGARETADALRPGAVVGNRSRHGHALHSCPRRDHRRHQSLFDAFRFRRGLIIVSDFFESRHITLTKCDPHRIWPDDGKPVALACIWERWRQPHDAPFEPSPS